MRVMITLLDDESKALRRLAELEHREPRAQASLLIRRELERLGLVKPDDEQPREPLRLSAA